MGRVMGKGGTWGKNVQEVLIIVAQDGSPRHDYRSLAEASQTPYPVLRFSWLVTWVQPILALLAKARVRFPWSKI